MIFLALSSGYSGKAEKRGGAEPEVRKVKPEARKVKPLPKKAKAKKPRHTFPVLKTIQKWLLKRLGLAHLKEEQVRELFKKLTPLIKKMHGLENQINHFETRADILMEQWKAEFSKTDRDIHILFRKLIMVMILRLEGVSLRCMLKSLENKSKAIRATYRKKKRDMRTTP